MEVRYSYKLSFLSGMNKINIKDKKNIQIYAVEMGDFDTGQKLFDFIPINANYVISGKCELESSGGSIEFGIMMLDGGGTGISVKAKTQGYKFAGFYA